MALAPEHISWYHLTLEPNTVFHARPPAGLPGDELAADIQSAGAARLEDAGYRRYEVSAWAKPGKECRHNQNYWGFGDYLAAGAGAHGKSTTGTGIRRFERPANPEAYMQSLERGDRLESRSLSPEDVVFEYMLNGLRLRDGFSLTDFERATGQDRSVVTPVLERLTKDGLLELREADRLAPSERGFDFLNELLAAFLPASGRDQPV